MEDKTAVKCQKCNTTIPIEKIKEPCPNCSSLARKYSNTFSIKLGLTATLSEHVEKIVFISLYIIIIAAMIAYYVSTVLLGKTLSSDIVIWSTIAISIIVLATAFITASIRITTIEKLKHIKPKFEWKTLDAWIDRLRLGAIIFLFTFISMYILMGVALPDNQTYIDFIVISATLGGLVLAAASFKEKGELRTILLKIAKKFIYATVLLIVFIVLNKILELAKFNPKFSCNWSWATEEIVFIISVFGLFAGVYSFSKAVIDLLYMLRKNWEDL